MHTSLQTPLKSYTVEADELVKSTNIEFAGKLYPAPTDIAEQPPIKPAGPPVTPQPLPISASDPPPLF
ncbi:MAG: hypothetical protein IPJ43_06575 [Saprospiraceae bacterium]|nr:hypothetical protein [Saprospiraceae bacterium]